MSARDDLTELLLGSGYDESDPARSIADIVIAAGWRPTTAVEYAVKHPVNGEPRLAREPLTDCRRYAEQFETTILHRYVGTWTDGEPT